MKIIIKPLGIVITILLLTMLIVLTIFNYQKKSLAAIGDDPAAKGVLLEAFSAASWRLDNDSADASLSVTADPNAPGVNNSVLRAVVQKGNPDQPYLVRASKNVPSALPENRALRLSIWGRSKTSSSASMLFEVGHPPYNKDLNDTVALTPKWKEYRFDFMTTHAYAAGEAQVRLIMGAKAGEFEFSGMELTDRSGS